MKEIVVISGKGGTGKTSVTASFSVLGGPDLVTADCDVDAADMHLLLEPDFKQAEDFYSGVLAVVDPGLCSGCGQCAAICRFNAIAEQDGRYSVRDLDCEGCGYCARICPEEAITMEDRYVGEWYRSGIKTGGKMVHARLGIGAENSGKLVAKVKNEARATAEGEGQRFVLVDGSPGIGCPVVSSLTGADFVIFVTEPTVSGLHDLRRVHDLVKRFGIRSGAIINKADINPGKREELIAFFQEEGILHLTDLAYDETFTKAMVEGETIVEQDESPLRQRLQACWQKIVELVGRETITEELP